MKNVRNLARKYGAKISAATGALALGASAHAGPFEDMMAAVDLTTVAAGVLAFGIVIVGIAFAFKSIDLTKRGVRKV